MLEYGDYKMTSPCSNPELEQKLHAYELGMLPDADREMVEVHLLECESCYSEIKKLEKASALLRDDETIRNVALSLASENAQSSDGVAWFGKYSQAIWPSRPYSKILPVAVVLLLVSVVLFQLLPEREQQEEIQQTLNLFPMRGSKPNVLILDGSKGAIINFVYESFDPAKTYDLQIISDGGYIVYALEGFKEFSGTGLGTITVSLDIFEKGIYKLDIIDSASDPPVIREQYYFEVEASDSR